MKLPTNIRPLLTVSAIAAIVTFAFFSNVLSFDFVNLDDPKNLKRLRDAPVFSEPLLGDIWSRPFLGHYQPLVPSTWWIMVPLARQEVPPGAGLPGPGLKAQHPDVAGLNPSVFHGLNLFIHSLNTALVVSLLCTLGVSLPGAFLGSVVFALHPVQAESVGWISVLGGLLSSFFILVALLCLTNYGQAGKRYYLAAFLAFLAAGFSKPLALVFPALVFVIYAAHFRKKSKQAMLDALPFAFAAIPFLLVALTAQDEDRMIFSVPWLDRPWIALDSVRFYLHRVVDFSLSVVDYGRQPNWVMSQPDIHGALFVFVIIVALALAAGIWALRRMSVETRVTTKSRFVLATGFFIIPLVPVLGFTRFFNQTVSTVADRYMYLSMIGVSVALGFAWDALAHRLSNVIRRVGAVALIIIMTIALGWHARIQVAIWNDTMTLFEATLKVNPRSWLAYTNIAAYYEVRGNSGPAIDHYLKSAELYFRTDPVLRAAIMLAENGKIVEAKAGFERVIAAEPGNAVALNNLAFCYFRLGDNEKARTFVLEALRARPGMPEALGLLRDLGP